MSTHKGVGSRIDRALLGASLFLAMVAIYYTSTNVVTNDSLYTMLVSEHFLLTGNLAVDEHFWPYVDSSDYPRVKEGKTLPRHIRRYNGHLYYLSPAGTPVLSAPFVFLMRAFLGESTIREDGGYRFFMERIWQKRIAALVTAATCLLLYLTASLLLTPRASLLIALAAGLSTQLWSTASRTMQAHTWLTLELSLALYLLLRWRVRRGNLMPVLLGTLLAAAFFTRPTAATIIIPLTLFVLIKDRKEGIWLVSTGSVWCTLLVLHYYYSYGTLLPPYYLKGKSLLLSNLPIGLAGQLLSPSRGLFVFVPLTLLVFYLLFRNWRFLPHRDLVVAILAAAILHGLSMAMFSNWWGGYSYGPRFSTDLVPLFAVLGMEGYAATAARVRSPGQGRSVTVWFLALLLVGALINGAGALSFRSRSWNSHPRPIAEDPSRAFDWGQSQFLCALFESRCP